MLNVYHSNNMDLLKTLVIQLIKNDPPQGAFTEEKILVQSTGISQWLKMGLAQELGIAANTRFPLPATFLWEMFNTVIPELDKDSAFSKELMKWKIMTLLPKVIDQPEFEPIKNYLSDDATGIKNHQLADKIADLYDQYSVFRPAWIAQWESSEWDKELVGNHAWQPILWKMLVEYTQELGQSPFHRANMYTTFIEKVKSGQFPKEKLPKRLFVVGISSLPPRFLEALEAISEHIEIHLMFANPCKFYWGDIKDRKYLARFEAKRRKKLILQNNKAVEIGETPLFKEGVDHEALVGDDETLQSSIGNTLLASMGKTGRDYLSLLSEKQIYEIDAFVDIERDSLLHCIQSDILNLEDRFEGADLDSNEHKGVISETDRSITLHGCYSPQREVELLHDYLLKRFNEDSDMTPLDVVVMVSDIDIYAHHINAVFGGAPRDRYIPFSVSDRTATAEAPVLQVFLDLLSIGIGRQEASAIMRILEVPAVMRKFGIDEDGLSTLHMWIEQSGIRWGLDNKTTASNGIPDLEANNWLFGLNRMIMGYAIPQEEGDFQGTLPYNESQGSVAELAGKLGMFIDTLIELRDVLDASYNIEQWVIIINNLIDSFFDITRDEEEAVAQIRTKVSELYKSITSAHYSDALSSEVIYRHFNSIFSKDRMSQHFMMGKVTFCTLMPMRSIPFNTVCLLGMNDGVYPRSTQPEGFDLMAANPTVGDRSRRNDDRYLFLEAILSAQDCLYMSFVSKKIQDKSEKVPSVLVSELLEYAQKGYCLEKDLDKSPEEAEAQLLSTISFEHALSPFNPNAFQGEYHSFAAEWVNASSSIANKTGTSALEAFIKKPLDNILLSEASNNTVKLDVSELLRFWSHPTKHFFTRRLKVNFDLQNGLSEDEEAFDLTPLTSFPVKRQWLDSLLEHSKEDGISSSTKDKVFDETYRTFSLAGNLPHGGFAKASLLHLRPEIEDLADVVCEHINDTQIDEPIKVEIQVGEITVLLEGWSRRLFKSGAVYYRSGNMRPQDILQSWIQHLCLSSMGHNYKTRILCMDKQVKLTRLSEEIALEALTELVEGYVEGMCAPLAFFPRTSFDGVMAGYSKNRNSFLMQHSPLEEKILVKMETSFSGGFSSGGESINPYISRVWPIFSEELAEELYNNGLKYLAPAIAVMEEI